MGPIGPYIRPYTIVGPFIGPYIIGPTLFGPYFILFGVLRWGHYWIKQTHLHAPAFAPSLERAQALTQEAASWVLHQKRQIC